MGGGYFWNSRKSQVFNMADMARREVEGGGGVGGVLHRSVSAVRRNGAGVDFCIFRGRQVVGGPSVVFCFGWRRPVRRGGQRMFGLALGRFRRRHG